MEFDLGMAFTVSVLFAIYFLPGVIALIRNHTNAAAILVLNLLLGWTALGWIVCLIWALIVSSPRENKKQQYSNP